MLMIMKKCFVWKDDFIYTFLGIMQQHRDKNVQHEFDTKDFSFHLGCSQGWPYDIGENYLSPNLVPKSTTSVTSLSQLNFGPFAGHISEVPSSGSNLKLSTMVS